MCQPSFLSLFIEMIVTSSGDKIAPVPIEAIIKDSAPIISNAVIIGDQREYLVCLITLKVMNHVQRNLKEPFISVLIRKKNTYYHIILPINC